MVIVSFDCEHADLVVSGENPERGIVVERYVRIRRFLLRRRA